MPRLRLLAPLLLLLLLLTGCALAPAPAQPGLPTPSAYEASNPPGATIARIGWREVFREPELQGLIDAALETNRDIRIASARVAEARAAWRIDGAALYPQLDGVGAGSRGRTFTNLPQVGGTRIDVRQVSAQLSAGWEVDFWGRLRNLREAARWRYLATEEARRAVATDLVAQVATGYLLERGYEERVALARRSIETREGSLRVIRRRYEVGAGSKLDMTQAQALLAQARTVLQGLERDRAVNLNALAHLVGRPVAVAPGTLSLADAPDDVSCLRAFPPIFSRTGRTSSQPNISCAPRTQMSARPGPHSSRASA